MSFPPQSRKRFHVASRHLSHELGFVVKPRPWNPLLSFAVCSKVYSEVKDPFRVRRPDKLGPEYLLEMSRQSSKSMLLIDRILAPESKSCLTQGTDTAGPRMIKPAQRLCWNPTRTSMHTDGREANWPEGISSLNPMEIRFGLHVACVPNGYIFVATDSI